MVEKTADPRGPGKSSDGRRCQEAGDIGYLQEMPSKAPGNLPYRTSTVVFKKKTFEIPAVTVPYRNRTVFPLIRKRLYYGIPTNTMLVTGTTPTTDTTLTKNNTLITDTTLTTDTAHTMTTTLATDTMINATNTMLIVDTTLTTDTIHTTETTLITDTTFTTDTTLTIDTTLTKDTTLTTDTTLTMGTTLKTDTRLTKDTKIILKILRLLWILD